MAAKNPPPDAATLAALLAEYKPLLTHAALQYTWLDLAELRAVWEDSVLSAYCSYEAGSASLGTWTRRVFRWRVRDLVRAAKAEPSTFGESLGEDPPILNGVNPEQAFWAVSALAEVLKLPPRDQTIVIAHLHSFTYAEIGEMLGISRARVGVVCLRAMRRLKTLGLGGKDG